MIFVSSQIEIGPMALEKKYRQVHYKYTIRNLFSNLQNLCTRKLNNKNIFSGVFFIWNALNICSTFTINIESLLIKPMNIFICLQSNTYNLRIIYNSFQLYSEGNVFKICGVRLFSNYIFFQNIFSTFKHNMC